MLDSFPARTLDVGTDFDTHMRYRPVKQYGSYQSDVVSKGEGQVYGGGTVFHSWVLDGIAIRVTNRSQETRSYQFDVVVFKSRRRKLVDRKISATIRGLKPGYAEDCLIELYPGEKLSQSVLEDLRVKNETHEVIAHIQPNVLLSEYAKLSWLYRLFYRLHRPAIYMLFISAVFTIVYRWTRSF